MLVLLVFVVIRLSTRNPTKLRDFCCNTIFLYQFIFSITSYIQHIIYQRFLKQFKFSDFHLIPWHFPFLLRFFLLFPSRCMCILVLRMNCILPSRLLNLAPYTPFFYFSATNRLYFYTNHLLILFYCCFKYSFRVWLFYSSYPLFRTFL